MGYGHNNIDVIFIIVEDDSGKSKVNWWFVRMSQESSGQPGVEKLLCFVVYT